MTLSNQHLSCHSKPLEFDPDVLGGALRERCPEVIFAVLMGSARDGVVEVGSDIDLALYVGEPPTLDLYSRALAIPAELAAGVHCDVGILNNSEPVYRFEALKGRLLFTRDQETYLRFFSITCREYESQLFDYERQHRYRMGLE